MVINDMTKKKKPQGNKDKSKNKSIRFSCSIQDYRLVRNSLFHPHCFAMDLYLFQQGRFKTLPKMEEINKVRAKIQLHVTMRSYACAKESNNGSFWKLKQKPNLETIQIIFFNHLYIYVYIG